MGLDDRCGFKKVGQAGISGGINRKDLLFKYPDMEDIAKVEYAVFFLEIILEWDANKQTDFIINDFGFKFLRTI